MTNLPLTTAEERYEMRADVLGGDRLTCDECLRLLADIQRLEAVAEAAKQYVEWSQGHGHSDNGPELMAALRQALAEAGKG